ncbi:flagellin [Blautia stercoris]|uniref:flagellin n=1 Tax=Blautia stercoris TaxID=871664 RepID=UPI002FE6EDE1
MTLIQNRLEYTVKVDNNTSENLQSAESRIRDTDMADEMTRFSKESSRQLLPCLLRQRMNKIFFFFFFPLQIPHFPV